MIDSVHGALLLRLAAASGRLYDSPQDTVRRRDSGVRHHRQVLLPRQRSAAGRSTGERCQEPMLRTLWAVGLCRRPPSHSRAEPSVIDYRMRTSTPDTAHLPSFMLMG